jgi:hypothetical protein
METFNNNEDLPIIDENIDNVSKSAQHYIKEHYLPQAIFLGILGIVFLVLFFYGKITDFFIFYLVLVLFAYNHVFKKVRHAFFEQFARANNFIYQKRGFAEDFPAPGLQVGYDRYTEDIINAVYKDCPLTFFNFNCTTGSGKHKQHHLFTVCEIRYEAHLPEIFLDVHRSFLTYPIAFGDRHPGADRKLTLEGDFNKYFTLYVPSGYEVPALQIFSPDVMQELIEHSKNYCLEFKGDRLYIYSFKCIKTKTEIYEFYYLAKLLITELAPELERMAEHGPTPETEISSSLAEKDILSDEKF